MIGDDQLRCSQSRRAVKRDEKYVCELERKLEKLCTGCAWQFVRDVTPESFEKWRARQATAKAITWNHFKDEFRLTFMAKDLGRTTAADFLRWIDNRNKEQRNPDEVLDEF